MKIYPRASVLLAAGFALLASPAYAAPARPDLTVAKLQVAGQTVTVTVKNAGPGKAKGSQVALSLSTDAKASKDDRVVSTAATKALSKRRSATTTGEGDRARGHVPRDRLRGRQEQGP